MGYLNLPPSYKDLKEAVSAGRLMRVGAPPTGVETVSLPPVGFCFGITFVPVKFQSAYSCAWP